MFEREWIPLQSISQNFTTSHQLQNKAKFGKKIKQKFFLDIEKKKQ